jgi:photosystem II stability/assembly factor-like uncharacterized protein
MTNLDRILRLASIAKLFALLLVLPLAASAEETFKDPLDFPARVVTNVAQRPLMAVVSAGDKLVAVGSRGLIIVSDDVGKSWRQAKVPVQSDLLAVHFPTEKIGWAVGHDGVVLRSDDQGESWSKQLDGRSAGELFKKYYAASLANGDLAAKQALELTEQNFKAGAALPYLDVWFEDVNKGFAVGAYGMLIATTDGGKTWTPWMDRIENDQLNLNAVRGVGGEVMIAGESGRIYKLDRKKRRFESISTGYAGSFFGLASNNTTLLAFGLRGVTYKSDLRGVSWTRLNMPTEATISAGTMRSVKDGFILVNGAGQILIGDRTATKFTVVEPQQRMRLTGVTTLPNKSVVVTGFGGVSVESLPDAQK